MLLTATLTLLAFTAQPAAPRPHLPASQVTDIATILAHDEGWPLGNRDYTLDLMKPSRRRRLRLDRRLTARATSSACTPSTAPPAM